MKVWNKRDLNAQGVYVGRPTKFGNPFEIGPVELGKSGTRAEVIAKFEAFIRAKPELMEAARRELHGKDLICWCAPQACHADVLMRIANESTDGVPTPSADHEQNEWIRELLRLAHSYALTRDGTPSKAEAWTELWRHTHNIGPHWRARARLAGVALPGERQRFEAWASDQGFPLPRLDIGDGESYRDLRTQGAWDAWQAALGVQAPLAPSSGDLLREAEKIIQALIVKSDTRLDRNDEFYAAAQWQAKVAALGVKGPEHG